MMTSVCWLTLWIEFYWKNVKSDAVLAARVLHFQEIMCSLALICVLCVENLEIHKWEIKNYSYFYSTGQYTYTCGSMCRLFEMKELTQYGAFYKQHGSFNAVLLALSTIIKISPALISDIFIFFFLSLIFHLLILSWGSLGSIFSSFIPLSLPTWQGHHSLASTTAHMPIAPLTTVLINPRPMFSKYLLSILTWIPHM